MTKIHMLGNYISIYFGHLPKNAVALTVDPVDDHIWWFPNFPVSSKNLRLIGNDGGTLSYIVNYELEPLTGRLTIPPSLPAYTSISASFFYYINFELDVLTKNFKPIAETPKPEIDIFGQPHYQIHNFYPNRIEFKIIITGEGQRALLTEPMFHAFNFIVIDRNIPTEYARMAYEGPLYSDEQMSMFKGYPCAIPTTLFVQNFGRFIAGAEGPITSFENPGGGETHVVAPAHGLSNLDKVTISGSNSYDGVWIIGVWDVNTFVIQTPYVDTDSAYFVQADEINWRFWENT